MTRVFVGILEIAKKFRERVCEIEMIKNGEKEEEKEKGVNLGIFQELTSMRGKENLPTKSCFLFSFSFLPLRKW